METLFCRYRCLLLKGCGEIFHHPEGVVGPDSAYCVRLRIAVGSFCPAGGHRTSHSWGAVQIQYPDYRHCACPRRPISIADGLSHGKRLRHLIVKCPSWLASDVESVGEC